MREVLAVARYEAAYGARNRWIDGLLLIFAGAAALICFAGTMSGGYASGLSRTAVSLLQVSLYLFPLAALLLGTWGCPWLRGSRGLLVAQPISRARLVLGAFAGQLAALVIGTGIGYGLGAAVVGYTAGTEGLGQYGLVMAVSLALLASFLGIAHLISSLVGSRGRALAIGLIVWFVAVVGYDLAVFASASAMHGRAVQTTLITMIFGNPVDLVRVVGLAAMNGTAAFGTAGQLLIHTFGEGAGITLMLIALCVWVGLPLSVAIAMLNKRDI